MQTSINKLFIKDVFNILLIFTVLCIAWYYILYIFAFLFSILNINCKNN